MDIPANFAQFSKKEKDERAFYTNPTIEKSKGKLTGSLKQVFSNMTKNVYLDSDSIVIDCGANIGDISSVMSRYGAKIYAFEPTKSTFEILEKRFSEKDNVECIQKAVWKSEGTIKLYHHQWSPDNEIFWSSGNSLLKEKGNVNENDYELVETIDLAEFVKQLGKVDLVKMDIEGAEIELINHLIDSKAIDNIDYLICETHERKNDFLKDSTQQLREKITNLGLNHKIDLNWF